MNISIKTAPYKISILKRCRERFDSAMKNIESTETTPIPYNAAERGITV